MVLDQWFKQTLCDSYFTEWISDLFGNGLVNKIRYYVLAILLGLFSDYSVTNQWIKPYTMW